MGRCVFSAGSAVSDRYLYGLDRPLFRIAGIVQSKPGDQGPYEDSVEYRLFHSMDLFNGDSSENFQCKSGIRQLCDNNSPCDVGSRGLLFHYCMTVT